MTTPLPDDVLGRYRSTIEQFVIRARRIASHSLQRDKQQFIRWVHGSARIQLRDGKGSIEFDVPDEERFESLAARCRPLLLQDEAVHYDKVFGALNAFVREDPDRRAQLDALRASWRKALNPEHPILMGVVPNLERPERVVTAADAADAWLYGDVVHADTDKPATADLPSLNQRYIAAVMTYGQVAYHATALLRLIESYQQHGILGLDGDTFDHPVTVATALAFQVARAQAVSMAEYQARLSDRAD